MKKIDLSIIVPVYNESEVVDIFLKTVEQAISGLELEYEFIFINDGSTDDTFEELKDKAIKNSKVKIINLSRNFGKEAALTAGLDLSRGSACIPMDCDLQDPPDLIPMMVKKWKEGHDVVLAKRIDRSSDGFLKRTTASIFYKLIKKISDIDIPQNVGDFRLMDRKVINVLKTYPERARFMKGIFASTGFRQATVEYVRPERVAGTTSWNYINLYKLAIEGLISFTSLPLKIWAYLGATVSFLSFFYGVFLVIRTLIFGVDVPGYASLMVVVLIMTGLILLSLGVIGEYLGRMFIEIKHRPIYIVMEKIGFED